MYRDVTPPLTLLCRRASLLVPTELKVVRKQALLRDRRLVDLDSEPSKIRGFASCNTSSATLPILFGILLLLCACKSSEHKMDDYLRDSRYADARALLEKKDVGATPSRKADATALALRDRYTADIEAKSKEQIDGLIAKGSTREAQKIARERRELCPWSVRLDALVERSDELISRIEATESSWAPVFADDAATVYQARRFLSELAPNRPWILDSDALRRFEGSAVRIVVREWAGLLVQRGGRLGDLQRTGMITELREIGITDAEMSELEKPLAVLDKLHPVESSPNLRLDGAAIQALSEARGLLGEDGRFECTSRLEPCVRAAWAAFLQWYRTDFTKLLESQQVAYCEIQAAEAWNAIETYSSAIRPSLGRAYVNLAVRRQRQGVASTLALLYAERAKLLGVKEDDAQLVEVEGFAQATRAASPIPAYRLDIDLEPSVDPQMHDLVKMAFIRGLRSGDNSLGRLDYLTIDPHLPRVTVTVRDAELIADFTDVVPMTSGYFSHFEDVANPTKGLLRSQLDSAEWNVDSKERAYSSAVSSHNIYPTQYSLNNVNSAYTAYSMAVNRFNGLVNQYNSTPTTISRPVYLPYTFIEGDVRFGWSASVRVEVAGNEPILAARESVAEDFVRIGSKATDRAEQYRREDRLDIDVSPTAGLGHLNKVVSLIKNEINFALGRLAKEPVADLDEEEQATLGWIYHPWGIQPTLADRLGVPGWAKSAAQNLELKRPSTPPVPLALKLPTASADGPLTAESAAASLAEYVCRTRSGEGDNDIGTGTGTLIGERGLILTCAHVLMGPRLRIEFPSGRWKGTYEGELVFVNSERDVALVRAKNLHNDGWSALRLAEPSRQGEPIVAIGNPGMNVGITNISGVSSGIVSNPRLEDRGSVYLSADVSIASGSSGGPLFSLRDGALIAVAQMVATSPGFPQSSGQVAATGYLCLAAPANELGNWLGIAYER